MLKHVAIIMDGNRRWARSKKLPIFAGHKKGLERVEDITLYAIRKGIKHITFWAFSTENWNRERNEVQSLMSLFRRVIQIKYLQKIINQRARIVILGDVTAFAKDIQINIRELIEKTKNNQTITVNIGLNYGGRAEIMHGINCLLKEKQEKISEAEFSRYLYTFGQPDPDLIIRTGGEKRLSGYLPWQSVYSELYFTKTYWPDFTRSAFAKALRDYSQRQRRFGK